jgi:hypothetical protein
VTEWWTYRLSSFLMFSPQAYWRLVERTNLEWWPAQLAAIAAGVAVAVGIRGPWRAQRVALLLLALAWAWVGWAFAWRRYAEIFLGAQALALACWLQTGLLVAACAWPAVAAPALRNAGALLVLAAALLYPLLVPVEGRPWTQAEVIGFLPDPTAVATLGALLGVSSLRRWLRALLAVIPVAVLFLGLATRWLLATA